MYILVNEELTKSQRIPQACHAVAEYMHAHGTDQEVIDWVRDHRTMVVLKCPENVLKCVLQDYRSKEFIDEDLGEFITAVAIHPMYSTDEFSHLKLA